MTKSYRLPKPLTKLLPKHKQFVSEYILDFNGTRAAKACGYTDKSASNLSCQWLKDDLIKQEISRLQAKQLETAGISQRYILETLRDIAEESKRLKTPANWQVAVRCLELLGKHLGLWDNDKDNGRQRRAHELTDKELIALGMELQKGQAGKDEPIDIKSETHPIKALPHNPDDA